MRSKAWEPSSLGAPSGCPAGRSRRLLRGTRTGRCPERCTPQALPSCGSSLRRTGRQLLKVSFVQPHAVGDVRIVARLCTKNVVELKHLVAVLGEFERASF